MQLPLLLLQAWPCGGRWGKGDDDPCKALVVAQLALQWGDASIGPEVAGGGPQSLNSTSPK